jgi:hypothetical protein
MGKQSVAGDCREFMFERDIVSIKHGLFSDGRGHSADRE